MTLSPAKTFAASIVLAALGTSAVAFGAYKSFVADSSKVTSTAASGHSGQDKTVVTKGAFLYEIEWSERDDTPCWFGLSGMYFENGDWTGKKAEYTGCKKKDASAKRVRVQIPDVKDLSEVRFIRSIQICTNDAKSSADEKLKGIRVKAVRLKADGSLVEENSVEDNVRTHCKVWHKEVSCPTGQAATGITFQHSYYGNEGVHGVRLECAPPKK